MTGIGLVGPERLWMIPEKYQARHEFCFFLHDQIAIMLTQYEESGVHNTVVDAFQRVTPAQASDLRYIDLIDLLKKDETKKLYKHFIISQTVLALTSDMLHFLYESLTCFEKRKFTVGFSLLRKPLKENLFYLSYILADEDDFIKNFEKNNYKTLNEKEFPKERKKDIFASAISKLSIDDAFEADLMWEIIYSRHLENGLEVAFQKSTHLITTFGELLKTEDYAFNRIFEDPNEDYHYQFIYDKLPYVLVFLSNVTLECFAKIHSLNEKVYSHLIISMMATYEALFLDSKSQSVTRMIKRKFRDFLKCLYCEKSLRISKQDVPRLFMLEEIDCAGCGSLNQVPIHWLFARAKVSVAKKSQSHLEEFLKEREDESMA